jgi:hypothetical protein
MDPDIQSHFSFMLPKREIISLLKYHHISGESDRPENNRPFWKGDLSQKYELSRKCELI